MAFMSESQKRTLRSICEAFCPSLSDEEIKKVLEVQASTAKRRGLAVTEEQRRATAIWCRCSAHDLQVAEAVESALAHHLADDKRRELGLLLSLLGTSVGTFLLCGQMRAFADLARAEREECLKGLRQSMFATKRKVFKSLKSLITFKFLSLFGPAGEANPAWAATGYPSPLPAQQVAEEAQASGWDEFLFQMLNSEVSGDTELEVDVVVVGSGCGGAVVAAGLSQDSSVLVLEKGGYFPRGDMDGTEGQSFDRMYESGALLATEDTGIGVLAGSGFGGGTAINWACCIRLPQRVREEWAAEHGLARFGPDSSALDAAADAVCQRIGVREGDEVAHNRSNRLFIEGCKACGYEVRATGQNMKSTAPDSPGAGNISIGDRHGIKNSATETFLRDAASMGCRFAERCHVERVLHSAGRATGVVGTILGKSSERYRITVRARKAVVISCGSIHTPALLLRSGLPNRNGLIGKNLRLHPVVGMYGQVPEMVEVWRGAPMTTVSDEGAGGIDGSHYGFKLEVPSIHLGLSGTLMPWTSGMEYRSELLQAAYSFPTIVLCRDKGCGEVRVDRSGNPRLYYPLGQHDREELTKGAEMLARVTAAVGAERIHSTSLAMEGIQDLPPLAPPWVSEEERQRAQASRAEVLDRYCALIRERGVQTDETAMLFSAHQMGTAKMSASPDKGVCKETGEVWEVQGLYVADASLFPTSSGSNPMLTTLTLAYDIAGRLRDTLRQGAASAAVRVMQTSKL